MNSFVIDIETAGRADAAEYLPEITAPSNYKDAAKIEAYLVEKRAAQLEQAALDATTARILCVGILRSDGEPQFIHDENETKLLRKTWLELETKEADEIYVTFNGTRFDWPMLARRSITKTVPVPKWFPLDGRWPHRQHCDLMALWQLGDRGESISLDRLSKLVLGRGKGGSGADFAKVWNSDRQTALDYLRLDLELTRDLFKRMSSLASENSFAPASAT